MPQIASEQVEEATRIFNRWVRDHDPDGNMDLLDQISAYYEWSKKNHVEKYLDATQGA